MDIGTFFAPNVSLIVAFLAGLFSFLSPCVFPLIPSYLSYVSGMSVDELTASKTTRLKLTAIKHSLMFILGFTLVFVLLGVFSSAVGSLLHSIWLMRVSGIFIILMGLFILGAFNKIKFLSFLSSDANFNLKNRPVGLIGSVLVGIVFAAAWTPCIGPILASILFIASTMHNASEGGVLLFVYAMGLAVPFLAASFSLNIFLSTSKKLRPFIKIISVIGGIILIIAGILIFFNYLAVISLYFGNTFRYNIPYNG
ncbi:cytochrome c biogenesis CcdA family protein [Candidatus Acidulodesulfobacterium sp. H_13]|uniref:cytochrome c biogenesis CcdA family protein n=1 Tax=Candidatus Acidulodesulfobacterium sp. H_13 TaxID=3395470 RepID=UPI003AF96AC0